MKQNHFMLLHHNMLVSHIFVIYVERRIDTNFGNIGYHMPVFFL